ncbi:helix-turn-helix domain-containing protein [Arcanobacterium ihumii]|uniref:helix-turn-helix domain-containing protein n=1 Tax=Arcanobacterium ihumii TaxID=2138162 RepID=UPI000F532FEE|nr:helix-turn-helix domain-containing protein [Arcanobacterium ihumii]
MKHLLSITEVAQLLQVSRGTVNNWINSNKVAHIVLPSGQFRILRDEVEKILTPVMSSVSSADEVYEDVPLFREGL